MTDSLLGIEDTIHQTLGQKERFAIASMEAPTHIYAEEGQRAPHFRPTPISDQKNFPNSLHSSPLKQFVSLQEIRMIILHL